jgi:hypothetical protein
MSDKKVKVKILKHVGAWVPGEVVEVDETLAKHLCHVNITDDGVTKLEHRRAMMLDEAESLEEAAKDPANLTAAEASALGIKNVVGPDTEAALADAEQKLKDQAEAELAAEEAAKSSKGKGKR